ncbi:MAG: hypothetical protein DI628_07830 [Blastochloris viridis]|uniref:Uncharacterized protein n=1 Tax=Blastochloris viridis TaxID=1079 RepID=A0A6N4RCH4_BLAVI|nr:MAG: hypothetical protein DI628_07830 [Blastochloris viridis]
MAPRKPVVTKPTAKTKTTAKPAARKAVAPAVATPVAMPETASCCCATSTTSRLCALLNECPLGKHICTRSFWASSVVAFIMLFITDWLVNNHMLMADYVATSAFWRTEGDIRTGLLITTQAVTALAYAAIILGMGHAARWWGATISGVVASVPVAMVSVNTYAMMPFAETDIPAAWAATALVQGALVGIAICAALKAARAPETHPCGDTCGCTKP